MTELAALGLKADSSGVVKATGDLDKLAGAATRAEDAADGLAKGTDRLRDASGKFIPKAQQAGDAVKKVGDEARTTSGSLDRMASLAGAAAASLVAMAATALSIGAYVRMADAWSDMRSQLGAATGDMGAANSMMQRMVDIANASYSPLNQTVEVYSRNVSILRDLGKGASEAADFTESLNHMLVITATKGERAASVQDALSKAMAVGKLQADGLETVLANGGRVAEALAVQLGTTVSGLRAFASQGKITGQVIADAIISPLDEVRAAAGEMPATIGDAFGRIGTNVQALVGRFDQTFAISETVASSLIGVADRIGALAQTDFAAWADGVTSALMGLAQIALILAATRLPALALSIASVNIATVAMIAQFTAGAIASRAITVAMAAQALGARALGAAMSLAGGPLGLLAAGAVALGLAFYNSRRDAERLTETLDAVTGAQLSLNDATETYYRDMTQRNLDAMKQQAEAARDAVKAALAAAQDELASASFTTNLFGTSLWETDRMAAARAEVQRLTDQLFEAESRMSAVDHAAANFASSVRDGTGAVVALTEEQTKAAASLDEMTRGYRDRADLARIERQYGQDSAQYMTAQLSQERAIMFAKIAALDVTEQQKVAARDAYDLMVKQEAATSGWNVQVGVVNGSLSDTYQALVKIRDTQPGDGFLSSAISKAADLALKLWDAVSANNALSAVRAGAVDATGASVPAGISSGDRPTSRPAGMEFQVSETGAYGGRSSAGGGGSSPSEAMADRLKALKESIASQFDLTMQGYVKDQEALKWALDNKKIAQDEYDSYLKVLRANAWGTEWELTALQYQTDQDALQAALDQKLITFEQYYSKLKEMQWANLLSDQNRSDQAQDLSNTAAYFGQLYSLTGSSMDGLLKLQKGFAAASALINAWVGYTTVLADPTVSFWFKLAAAGQVLAAGLGAVSAIKGASKSGSGGGGSGSGGSTTSASTTAQDAPLRVSADAFDPTQLYSGEAVQRWFDAIQEEAGNRGITWVPN
jgi:tape measure domain-containing protein